MTRKPTPRVLALPLSSLPELQRLLAPFLGGERTRSNVVMVRLADDALGRVDQLVDAGLFGSRSEAAAFLVGAGIRSQKALLDRIGAQTAEIARMRKSLRQTAVLALRETSQRRPPRRK